MGYVPIGEKTNPNNGDYRYRDDNEFIAYHKIVHKKVISSQRFLPLSFLA